jgi:hypothetical protein
MSPMAVSLIVFACVIVSTIIGLALRRVLPQEHLSEPAKDVVKQSMALIATMAALVLGLLVASAKNSWDTQASELRQIAADSALLDRNLQLYGPETAPVRANLRQAVGHIAQSIWQDGSDRAQALDSEPMRQRVAEMLAGIEALEPRNGVQKFSQTNAIQLLYVLGQTRFALIQQQTSSIPAPFLVILTFWLSVLFLGFAVFSPRRNPTVIAALLVCALSASSAMFLILELDHPFSGLLSLSDAPLREALRQMQE